MIQKEKIYELVKAIPPGNVTTYGELAESLGNKYLARVVGNVLHNNPDPANIPDHGGWFRWKHENASQGLPSWQTHPAFS